MMNNQRFIKVIKISNMANLEEEFNSFVKNEKAKVINYEIKLQPMSSTDFGFYVVVFYENL